jgi:FdrA protein
LVSVPGRFAARVARDALELDRHVFLFSDNVPLADEIELKRAARRRGLLLMGPDCGTAIVGGASLGFANRVRRGRVGLVGASGTGLQAVTVGIHNLGAGISQAIGTGTHDLSTEVGALTARQGLDLLKRDSGTDVIVIVSKPPSPSVAERLLCDARAAGKPVVVDFVGYSPAKEQDENIHFARTLSQAAQLAASLQLSTNLANRPAGDSTHDDLGGRDFAAGQRYLRGLYSGGTLAYEALWILRDVLGDVYSNAPLDPDLGLANPAISQSHTVLDLGADEFTVGRLHPMLDNDLRIRRINQEADDPDTAVLLLDVVLGFGSHPDPSSELAPAIAHARERAARAGRYLEIVAVVVGTDEDPQDSAMQTRRLREAGAIVVSDHAQGVVLAGKLCARLDDRTRPRAARTPAVLDTPKWSDGDEDLAAPEVAVDAPFAAINVGLESFYTPLAAQGFPCVQVDWRPPAGGNEKMMAVLEQLKRRAT